MQTEKITIINSEWIDNETFVVNFEPKTISLCIIEQILVEYHKDKDEWIIVKEFYCKDKFIDSSTEDFRNFEKERCLQMAKKEYAKYHIDLFEEVCSADEYRKVEAFKYSIEEYLGEHGYILKDKFQYDEQMNKLEDICNKHIINMFREIHEEFIK